MSGTERYRDEADKNPFSHVCEACEYGLMDAGENVVVNGAAAAAVNFPKHPVQPKSNWDPLTKLSLLDTAFKQTTTYWLVYMNAENPRFWNRMLKPGFQHVQLWRSIHYGPRHDDVIWLRVDPGLEFVRTDLIWTGHAPWRLNPLPTSNDSRVGFVVAEFGNGFLSADYLR